jgi:hypothetical protein
MQSKSELLTSLSPATASNDARQEVGVGRWIAASLVVIVFAVLMLVAATEYLSRSQYAALDGIDAATGMPTLQFPPP